MANSSTPYPRPAYAWFVVAVLTLAYTSSFIDRMILNLLVEPMRRDLQISDTQMSLLMGLSFALFYSLFGLPIGRLADSGNRRRIITVGIVIWSVMTALCGIAKSYTHFLLARVGVGVGEATLSPAANSMLADYFPKEKLGTAMSVYTLGIYLGNGLAILLGGLSVKLAQRHESWSLPVVGEIFPWQMVFFIVGIPGVLIALLMLAVKEPARRGAAQGALPLRSVAAYLKRNARAVLSHHLGFGLLVLAGFAFIAWVPTAMVRSYGWSIPRAAISLGLIMLVCGTLGSLVGGWLSDYYMRRGFSDARLRAGLVAAIGLVPSVIVLPLASSPGVALAALAASAFFLSVPFGPALAALQEIVPANMRGQAAAIYLLVINLLGMGLGPTLVALLTDYVFADDLAVRHSIACTAAGAALAAAAMLWQGMRSYRASVAQLNSSPYSHA